MSLRFLRGAWQAALVAAGPLVSIPADELSDIRAIPAPARVPLDQFQAPGRHMPSRDLGIVALPTPHFAPGGPDRSVDTVVIHYTSGINILPEDPYDVDLNWKIFAFYEVGSHYLIDREGHIFQLVRESDVAWHAGGSIMPAPDNREGVNAFSIGIEVIGILNEPFEDAQYEALIRLVRDIRQRHAVPMENIVGHEHIAGQRAVDLGLRRDVKTDPGPSFDWDRLRAGLEAEPVIPDPRPAAGPVSGTVYRDENANGLRDDGERAWEGVGVSDGISIAVTDEEGRYTLEPSDGAMELVFVIQPADCRLTPNFYRHISRAENLRTLDFGLVPQAVPEGPVMFAQVSDVHVGRPADFGRFLDALEEVDGHPAPIDFIVATGDLVNRGGTGGQLSTYAAVVERAERPWMSVFGNHDSDTVREGTRVYRHHLGPDYYAFDRGDCHFVARNSIFESEAMDRWIDEEVRLFGQGKTLVIFQHYPPTNGEQIERFASLGARAVASGHWHSNRIVDHDGLLSINTPTFMMGGIDVSPSGFRLVTLDGDTVTSRFLYGRTGRILTVQAPAETLGIEVGETMIHTAIYDSENGIAGADYQISGGAGVVAEERRGSLEQMSELSWYAEFEPLLTPGPYVANVTARDLRGDTWTATQGFTLSPAGATRQGGMIWPQYMGTAAHLGQADVDLTTPLGLDWIAHHHASIDFGSPVTDGERVYIGLRDRNGLDYSGVNAFHLDGRHAWYVPTESAICGSPAVSGELVFAIEQAGRVLALDARTGDEVWTHDIGSPELRWMYSSPVLAGSELIVGNSKMVEVLDAATGQPRWSRELGSDWISSLVTPAVSDGVIVLGGIWQAFGDERGHGLVALSLETGDILWTASSQGFHAAPAILDGRVYTIDIDGKFNAWALTTGERLWGAELFDGWTATTPAIDAESGILVTGSADGVVHAFDIAREQEIWSFRTGSARFRMSAYQGEFLAVLGSPTICGETVFIGSSDGRLRALDLRTGDLQWSHDFGVPVLSAPCPIGDGLVTGGLDGSLFCLRSGDGATAVADSHPDVH